MITIGPLQPPVNVPKVKKTLPQDSPSETTEVNKDAQPVVVERPRKRRSGKDRRQRNMKPLIDLRSHRERRQNSDAPGIDIEV